MAVSWRQYFETGVEVAVAFVLYYFFGWVGFAAWTFFIAVLFLRQLSANQRAILGILTARLPDRCAFCHREIVDEGGIFDEEGLYHANCIDRLDSLEEHRKIAGVPREDAIHKPRPRKVQTNP